MYMHPDTDWFTSSTSLSRLRPWQLVLRGTVRDNIYVWQGQTLSVSSALHPSAATHTSAPSQGGASRLLICSAAEDSAKTDEWPECGALDSHLFNNSCICSCWETCDGQNCEWWQRVVRKFTEYIYPGTVLKYFHSPLLNTSTLQKNVLLLAALHFDVFLLLLLIV